MDAGGRATHGAVAEIRYPWIPASAGMTGVVLVDFRFCENDILVNIAIHVQSDPPLNRFVMIWDRSGLNQPIRRDRGSAALQPANGFCNRHGK